VFTKDFSATLKSNTLKKLGTAPISVTLRVLRAHEKMKKIPGIASRLQLKVYPKLKAIPVLLFQRVR
jgi:hypothetical protein